MKACLQVMAALGIVLSTVAANSHAQDMGDMDAMGDMNAEMAQLMALANPDEATIRSIANGNWSDPATWNLDRIPADGDRVHIAANHVLTLDGLYDAPLRTIRLDGTLAFATDRSTSLRVETLVSSAQSLLTMGTEQSPLPAEFTARLIIDDYADEGFERSDMASPDYDPAMLGLGLITHGRFESAGSERAHGGVLALPPMAGDTTLSLEFDPIGWAVNDEIVIAGTTRDALGDELRHIIAVAGRTVTLDAPLEKDHAIIRHTKAGLDLAVHVINLERNVVVETAEADRSPVVTDYTYTETTLDKQYTIDLFHRRGHVMFMHSKDVAVRNTRFHSLGRTNKHGAVDDVTFNADGSIAHAGINPRARYSVHFHRAGLDGAAGLIEGSVADDSPGWCFVSHGSRAHMRKNVAYNCDGSGFVTERGDELGSLIDNISIRNDADEGKSRGALRFQTRKPINDFGFGGHGFWLQGINVDVQRNVSSGAGREAFALYPLMFDNAEKTRFALADIPEPQRSLFSAPVSPQAVPMHTFNDNVSYGSNIGLMIGEHRPDEASLISGFTGWMLNMGTSYNYSDGIRFDDMTLIGNLDKPEGLGAYAHHGTSNVEMNRPHVEGFAIGLQLPRAGNRATDTYNYKYSSIKDAWLNNVLNFHALQIRNHDFLHVDIERPRFGILSGDALSYGINALAEIDQNDDLDIDSSNVRSNGFAELGAEVASGAFAAQQDYYLHYTQTAGSTVDTRHQRDGFLPKRLTVLDLDGKRYRLFFKTQQTADFIPFPTSLYQAGRDYDLNNPLDVDAPNNNRNSNLPAEFLDKTTGEIATLFQQNAENPHWVDFAFSKDRIGSDLDVDAAVDYPGFALAPSGRLLPADYATDTRFESWPRTKNLVAMRVDDLPDFVDYIGDDAIELQPVNLDTQTCTLDSPCLPELMPLTPTRLRMDDDSGNGRSVYFNGISDTFALAAPFSLEHKSFTWHANLRPLDTTAGVVIDSGDTQSGYRIAFSNGRLVASLASRGVTTKLYSAPVVAGNWVHAMLMVNQGLGQAILYVDGVRQDAANLPAFQSYGGNTLRLGAAGDSGFAQAKRFRGFVDNLVISVRTYTDTAAAALSASAAKPVPLRANRDADNDGLIDLLDAAPLNNTMGADQDADRLADAIDDDIDLPFIDGDDDGVPDFMDAFPALVGEWADSDNDGTGDNSDDDIDGDGVVNNLDAFPNDAAETDDRDGDGVGDRADHFPDDASESLDSDGDGVGNQADALPYNASDFLDTDNDGVGDTSDLFPDNAYFSKPNNLVSNPGIETDSTGWDADASNGQVIRDTTRGFDSAASLKLLGESGNGKLFWLGDLVSLGPEPDRLHLQAMIRTENSDSSELRIAIDYRDSGVLKRAYRRINIDNGSAEWRHYSETFTLPSGAETVQLRLKTSGTVGSTVWFDDIALYASATTDTDADGIEDRLDADDDNDGYLDGEDPAPLDASIGPPIDNDHDGVIDENDNCRWHANPNQRDTDNDQFGDTCDADDDNDGYRDAIDALPLDASEHSDWDADGLGDISDPDDDNDGIPDTVETAFGLNPKDASDAEGDLDRDGVSNLDEYTSGTALNIDDVAPWLLAPADLSLTATGPLTEVDLGLAEAGDTRDGSLIASPSPAGPYVSGQHEIVWQVSDAAGNSAEALQQLSITPQLFLSGPSVAIEGATINITFELNGDAAHYPVRVPYFFSGSAGPADFAAPGTELTILSGRSASIDITTYEDQLAEGDDTITLTLGTPENAAIGDAGVHTIILREANVAPVVSLSIRQAGLSVSQINRTAGLVTIEAQVTDANADDSHTFEWSSSNNDLMNQASIVANSLTFDPASIAATVLSISVTATDTGDGQLSVVANSAILITEPDETVSPIIDSDGDRIPDNNDTLSELWLLPSGVGTALIQTVPGQRLVLGETVFAEARHHALLLPGDLDTLQGEDAMSQKETSGIGYLYPAGLFDIEIHGIASGGVAHLVIPVDGGIPDGAHVRHRDPTTGQWQDVELTDSDKILSFGNSTDACPEPLHSRYVPGLSNGAHCLQLTITDGGLNDADGSINGVVSLAVGIAVESLALPTIVAENVPRNTGAHITERGEQVVLAFSLSSDHVDAELDDITLQASGVLDVATDIQQVTLYADTNGNGIAEATERLATSHYNTNSALLSFTLGTPHELLVGTNAFLVTYQF